MINAKESVALHFAITFDKGLSKAGVQNVSIKTKHRSATRGNRRKKRPRQAEHLNAKRANEDQDRILANAH